MKLKKILSVLSAFLLTVPAEKCFSAKSAVTTPEFTLPGDVNADNAVNIADAVMLQKWILCQSSTLSNWKNADLSKDNAVNSFDLVILKKMIVSSGDIQHEYSGLVINEICSPNKKSFKDESGCSPDWIEIYNSRNKSIDISGVGLSDGNKNRYKFTFPKNTVIDAKGYILVLCDDTNLITENEYHAPFKLSATGETAYLTSPENADGSDGFTIDSVSFKQLDTDVTYGRFENGSEDFAYLTPTPMKSNDSAQVVNKIEAPVFSERGGFYDTGFALSLYDANGNKVYYTTDGSDPRTSPSAKLYSSSINIYDNTKENNIVSAVKDITYQIYNIPSNNIDKGIIVRAASTDGQNGWSNVITNGYYIGKNEQYYKDMKVISLSVDKNDLFDKTKGIYMAQMSYEQWKSSAYRNNHPNDMSNPANYNQSGEDWERPCNMQVYENGKLKYSGDLGVRISGNWSRGFPQKSLKLYARSKYGSGKIKYDFFNNLCDMNGNEIVEFDNIVLHNGGSDWNKLHARDELIQKMAESLDLMTQAQEPCIVFIDGEFWGLYFIREKFDSDYIEEHFGIDNATVLKEGAPEKNHTYDDFKEFMEWIFSVDASDADVYKEISSKVDIDNLIDYFCTQTYINNYDWGRKEYSSNWMVWRSEEIISGNKYSDGKWRFALYDTDNAGASSANGENLANYDKLGNMAVKAEWNYPSQLFYNLLANAEFRSKFRSRHTEISNIFSYSNAIKVVNEYESVCKDALNATINRFYGCSAEYDSERERFLNFFSERKNHAEYYADKLLKNYKQYLTGPITVGNLINSESLWTFGTQSGGAGLGRTENAEKQAVTCTQAGTVDHSVYYNYENLNLKNGETYQLSFKAKCGSGKGKIRIFIGEQKTYQTFLDETINLTTDEKEFVFTTKQIPALSYTSYLSLQYGIVPDNYTVSDIVVKKIKP